MVKEVFLQEKMGDNRRKNLISLGLKPLEGKPYVLGNECYDIIFDEEFKKVIRIEELKSEHEPEDTEPRVLFRELFAEGQDLVSYEESEQKIIFHGDDSAIQKNYDITLDGKEYAFTIRDCYILSKSGFDAPHKYSGEEEIMHLKFKKPIDDLYAQELVKIKKETDSRDFAKKIFDKFLNDQVSTKEKEPGVSDLNIGLPNTKEDIENFKLINDIELNELEETLKHRGYLATNESLKEVMRIDNEYVTSKNLTHQELAQCLFAITNVDLFYQGYGQQWVDEARGNAVGRKKDGMDKVEAYIKEGVEPFSFTYRGIPFIKVVGPLTRGVEPSPFNDATESSNHTIIIKNLNNDEQLQFSTLVAHMIHRYGFYEGNVPFRVEPKQIIKVFELDKK
jgi:hypothetical protein